MQFFVAERAIGGEPFAVLLADDFITDSKTGVTRTLIKNFEKTMKSQLSVMSVKKVKFRTMVWLSLD